MKVFEHIHEATEASLIIVNFWLMLTILDCVVEVHCYIYKLLIKGKVIVSVK